MSDRTSAALFREVFSILVEYVPEGENRDAMALRFWGLTQDCDFSPNQMSADDALFALGLARRGVDPDWPDAGEVVLYGPVETE